MKSGLSQIKDVNMEILNKLDDKDLLSFCSTDKYAKSICNDQIFWQRRVISKYGKYLDIDTMRKYKEDRSWSEYYIELTKKLNSQHLGYEMSKAMEFGREDLIILLREIKEVRNIEHIIRHGIVFRDYYIEHEKDGKNIRQGKEVSEGINNKSVGEFKNNMIISMKIKTPGYYTEKYYHKNGKIKSFKQWDDEGELIKELYYDESGNQI